MKLLNKNFKDSNSDVFSAKRLNFPVDNIPKFPELSVNKGNDFSQNKGKFYLFMKFLFKNSK
jgi:hypothetical protein